MTDCRRTIEQLTRFVDGDLPAAERADVERHLDRCPPCRRAAADEDAGRTVIRHVAPRLPREPLPPGLRTRCEALLRETQAARPRPWWQHRIVASLASAVLVLVTFVAVFALATRRSDVLLAQQLTADHAKCFTLFEHATHLDALAAQRELLQRYGWDVPVPPSSAALGIALVGARRCLYAAGTIPHMMYRVKGRAVSLFVLDGEHRDASVVTLDHRSRMWTEGDRTYVLVSSQSDPLDDGVVSYLRGQMRMRAPM